MASEKDFVPLRSIIPFWPADRVTGTDGDGILDRVGVRDFFVDDSPTDTTVKLTVVILDEFSVGFPGLDGFEFILGSAAGETEFTVEIDVRPQFQLRLIESGVLIRLRQDLLQPAEQTDSGSWQVKTGDSGATPPYEVRLEGITLIFDEDGDLELAASGGPVTAELDPFIVAETGVVVQAGEFLIGLDARYRVAGKGELIDIGAGVEMFFALHDMLAWHLYLGIEEPRERRIRAEVLKIFEANAYFMLSARDVRMGAWIGWELNKKFGPLRVYVEAWIEGKVHISWRPPHFFGSLWLHGAAGIEAFGIGIGLSVDAKLSTDVFDPFAIEGRFRVKLRLPWPLPDPAATIRLKWGGDDHEIPQLPLPVKDIAIEHLKTDTSWRLMRKTDADRLQGIDNKPTLLHPDYDDGSGLRKDLNAHDDGDLTPPPDGVVVIPVDARPRVTFSRPIHDEALVGDNVQPLKPDLERIGDPSKKPDADPPGDGPITVRYEVSEMAIQKHLEGVAPAAGSWSTVAIANSDKRDLFSSWAPIPSPQGRKEAVDQTKLWIWSKNPFDYTRRTASGWNEAFIEGTLDYPCVEVPATCYDFENVEQDIINPPWPWSHPDHPALKLTWIPPHPPPIDGEFLRIARPFAAVEGLHRAVFLPELPQNSDEFASDCDLIIDMPANLPPGDSTTTVLTFDDPNRVEVLEVTCEAGMTLKGIHVDAQHLYVNLPNVKKVHLRINSEVHLFQVCMLHNVPFDEFRRRSRMANRLQDLIQHWSEEDAVFEPYQQYRLKITTKQNATGHGELSGAGNVMREQTEFAYFRTSGPPGLTDLSLPPGIDANGQNSRQGQEGVVLSSELDDLTLYVDQTTPATVPKKAGEKPPLPRPVFRAYDVCVDFNENYVSQMYRMAGRDLMLHVFDANGRPARDVKGRLLAAPIESRNEDHNPLEDDTTARWISTVNASSCVRIDPDKIIKPDSMCLGGFVLRSDMLHEARLVPMLVHDRFDGYEEGNDLSHRDILELPHHPFKWPVIDQGTTLEPSRWRIDVDENRQISSIVQESNTSDGNSNRNDVEKLGTLLVRQTDLSLPANHPDRPRRWSDYRFSVQLESSTKNAIGVVFRYRSPDSFYRFSMDARLKYRRLVRVADGLYQKLAEDNFVFERDNPYTITVEALGPSLRVYQDGELVFDVMDETVERRGSIGLYCWNNEGARFSDVQVHDYRDAAPVLYRFKFVTSLFANFFDQIRSYEDVTWKVDVESASPERLHEELTKAVPLSTAEDESRAFNAATRLAVELGNEMRRPIDRLDVSRIDASGNALAFLIHSPEPIDWRRTTLKVLHAVSTVPSPPPAGKITLANANWSDENEEAHDDFDGEQVVTLQAEEKTSLSGVRIERRSLSEPLDASLAVAYVRDHQTGGPRQLLFRDQFELGDATDWKTFDDGPIDRPSNWHVVDGQVRQTSTIRSSTPSDESPEKLGTHFVAGSRSLTDYVLSVRLRSGDEGTIGVLFRYQDQQNYYLFSMDRQRSHRQLVRRTGDTFTTLWEDDFGYETDQTYEIIIVADGKCLRGYVDGVPMFQIQDSEFNQGQIGLFAWANAEASFSHVRVYPLEVDDHSLLFHIDFEQGGGSWQIVDQGELDGPSQWRARDGYLQQTSNIRNDEPADKPDKLGAIAVAEFKDGTDYRVSVGLRVENDNGAIGVVFRYQDPDNYYRFSMDNEGPYRRLVKRVDGTIVTLWEDTSQGYETDRDYTLTIAAQADTLRVSLDENELAVVADDGLSHGRVGLYVSSNQGAKFQSLEVAKLRQTRRFYLDFEAGGGRWDIVDQGRIDGPSQWGVENGRLEQTSNIRSDEPDLRPDKLGAMAIAVSTNWSNYRLSVGLRVEDDDGAIGAVFRYQDEGNYYRFSMDKQRRYRRLVKCVAGDFTTLWEDTPRGYQETRDYILTIDCLDSQLQLFLDGKELAAVNDDSISEGRFGLYVCDNNGAQFGWIQVCEPQWWTYYVFGPDETVAPGSRRRVLSGKRFGTVVPPHDGKTDLPTELGALSLRRRPAELRIVDGIGTIVDFRQFVANEAFTPLDGRILRNADGTGFLLLSADGRSLQPGIHRLRFRYRREVLPELSQEGVTSDEVVTIDLPFGD